MGTHDIPDSERYNDDWPDDWGQRRIAQLKESLADVDPDDLGDAADIQYDDRSLDDAHDNAGYYDGSGDDSHAIYTVAPTWWENVVARLWWWRWVIPLVALLVPLSLLAGGFAVLTLLSGDESGSDSAVSETATVDVSAPAQAAEWPPAVTFAQHTIPALIRHELPFAGAMHGYLFTGQAGDAWVIEVEPDYDSALDPKVAVYGPDGHEVATNDNRTTGDRSAEVRLTLSQAGAYRVVIQAGGDGLTTGMYWLMVNEE